MDQDRIVITDCNHLSFEEEERVAEKNGFGLEVHDLLGASPKKVAEEIRAFSVIACQRLAVDEELLSRLRRPEEKGCRGVRRIFKGRAAFISAELKEEDGR